MKAKIQGGYDHVRQKLADIVPIDAPFSVFLASTQTCNFRCFYCTHSRREKENIHLHTVHMEDHLFQQKKFSLGNVQNTSLRDIWLGKKLYDLQMEHLQGGRSRNAVCAQCENYLCFTPKEDNLDQSTQEIQKRLEARGHV